MQIKSILAAAAIVLAAAVGSANAEKKTELSVSHLDPDWRDGKGDVPEKGICLRDDGKSLSPSIKVTSIPAGTKLLILKFTDDDYGYEGGHGVFKYKLAGETEIKISPIGGEKDFLPPNIIGGEGHHCGNCWEEDYLGPCSGGKGHIYRVNIYAQNKDGEILAKGTLLLGTY